MQVNGMSGEHAAAMGMKQGPRVSMAKLNAHVARPNPDLRRLAGNRRAEDSDHHGRQRLRQRQLVWWDGGFGLLLQQ
jgi:hypothetical protein